MPPLSAFVTGGWRAHVPENCAGVQPWIEGREWNWQREDPTVVLVLAQWRRCPALTPAVRGVHAAHGSQQVVAGTALRYVTLERAMDATWSGKELLMHRQVLEQCLEVTSMRVCFSLLGANLFTLCCAEGTRERPGARQLCSTVAATTTDSCSSEFSRRSCFSIEKP